MSMRLLFFRKLDVVLLLLCGLFFCLPLYASSHSMAELPVNESEGRTVVDSQPAVSDVLNDITWYIAELHINGNVAEDFVDVGIDTKEHIYLPAAALLKAGEASVDQPDTNVLQLRVNNTEQFLNIDITKQRLSMENETRSLRSGEVIEHDGQIFVLSALFESAFDTTIQFSSDIQTLSLSSARPWPLDLRIAREYRWKNPESVQIDPVEPIVVNYDYQLLGTPHVDIDLAWDRNAQNRLSNHYNMLLLSEALYMTNVLVTSGSIDKPFEHVRIQSGRQDLRGNVFGISSLYDVQFGDVSGQSVPLVGVVPDGRGLRFQAAPLSRTTNFDSTEIEGDAPPGWQAELYIGMQLYSFQQIGSNGRFRFNNIPIGYGSNRIKVVLYGPQGQTREVNYQKDISSNIVPPGEFQSFGYLAQNHHTVLGIDDNSRESVSRSDVSAIGNLQVDYGVSHWLSLGAFVARSELHSPQVRTSAVTPLMNQSSLSVTAQDYYGVELRPVLNNVNMLGGIVQQKEAGQGYYGRVYVPLRYLPLSVDYEHYAPDYLSAYSFSDIGKVSNRIKARVGLPLDLLTDALGYASVEFRTEQTYNGHQQLDAELNYSHRLGRVFFTHFFNYQQAIDRQIRAHSAEKKYRLLASFQRDLFDFRAEMGYNFGDVAAFDTANFSALWRYNDNNSAGLGMSYSPHDGVGSALYINYDLNFSTLSLGVSRTAVGDYTLSAGLNFELGYQRGEGLTVQSAKNMYGGSATVMLQKQDDNGRISPLDNVGITVNEVSQDSLSDQTGKVELRKLTANDPTILSIQADSLPDPFLIPEYPKVEIWPRAGQNIPVNLKVLSSKVVSGVVRRQNDHGESVPVEGVKIQFINAHGRVQAETETLSDGYYNIDSLYAGRWQLRINPQNVLSSEQKKSVNVPFNLSNSTESSEINITILPDGAIVKG
ncbi:MSCRAMM family protein [Plesiomonas sp.]|uniref:MSCRAMM family protein n=1 Tax=Plesiomonas sp. TaxID=2486279 RepID=UPI003F2B7A9E